MTKQQPMFTPETRAKGAASSELAKDAQGLLAVLCPDLSDKRRAMVLNRLAQMPATHRRRYCKAVAGRSLAACVAAFCAECVGWDRSEVEKCTSLACPLYTLRPYQQE